MIQVSCNVAGCGCHGDHGDASAFPFSRFNDVDLIHPAAQGDPRFHALLKELGDLHDRKQLDYGTGEDPFANVRASEDWYVAPWVGAMIRATDKMRRLQSFNKKGTLANEGVEDSLLDLAVYTMIALILFREDSDG